MVFGPFKPKNQIKDKNRIMNFFSESKCQRYARPKLGQMKYVQNNCNAVRLKALY